jgi:cell division protein ZapA
MMRIELLGTSFQIQSDESPEYIRELLDHYRTRIDRIEQTVATGDPLKKAILAALLVTDELFTEHTEDGESRAASSIPASDAAEIDAITSRLLTSIDETLSADITADED